jgi:hypothetical protein
LRSKLAALDDVGTRSVSRHEDVRFETGPSGVRGERSNGVTRTRNGELGGAKIFRHGYGDGHVARFKESDFCLSFLNKKWIKAPLTDLSYRLLSPASNDQIYEKPSLL